MHDLRAEIRATRGRISPIMERLRDQTARLPVDWRGGRVAEGGGLLNRCTVKSCTGGSNPPLSAFLCFTYSEVVVRVMVIRKYEMRNHSQTVGRSAPPGW